MAVWKDRIGLQATHNITLYLGEVNIEARRSK